MTEPRYRAVSNHLGHLVFEGDRVIATCTSHEVAERIARVLNADESGEG